jgi:hypothetical protein
VVWVHSMQKSCKRESGPPEVEESTKKRVEFGWACFVRVSVSQIALSMRSFDSVARRRRLALILQDVGCSSGLVTVQYHTVLNLRKSESEVDTIISRTLVLLQ